VAWLARPGGCRLSFEVFGDPRRQPLLLLEGLGGSIAGWRRNVPHLAAELFVVAFDHRGNGATEAPDEAWTMSTFVEDAIALLDELRIARTHVYGLSFGGMVAQELAIRHPRRVRTIVLGATHAGGPCAVRSTARVPKDRPWLALYSDAFVAEHPDEVAADRSIDRDRARPSGAARAQWAAIRDWSSCDRLDRIHAPTLVLHGTADRTVDPANARVLADAIAGAELVWLDGAGHLYHREQPDRADEAVLRFVRKHLDA
jgi:pimeloyl-ACP methyl ester carboxylesterase